MSYQDFKALGLLHQSWQIYNALQDHLDMHDRDASARRWRIGALIVMAAAVPSSVFWSGFIHLLTGKAL
jgi:hypothetical protein